MKKILALTLAFVLVVSLCGLSAFAEDDLFTAGTYTATAAGRNGDVTVSVTFSEDAITDIIVESEETETVGVAAMEALKEQVLATQSVAVDAVSGATVSSNAFVTALRDCIVQAGADPDALAAAVENTAGSKEEAIVTDADIIVIGAGGAGLSAAVTAAEEGASVILLEKSGVVGGNTIMAMAGINAADSKIQLADEQYAANGSKEGLKELQMNNDDVHEELVDAYVENSGEFIDWIAEKGVEFTVHIQEDQRNTQQNYWMLMSGGFFETGNHIISALNNNLKSYDNIHLYVFTEATRLLTDETGAVTGVKAVTKDGEEINFTAKKVILATGGFCANRELFTEYRPDLANAVFGVNAPTTGQGIEMAVEVGAVTVNMADIQTFPQVMVGYGMITPPNTSLPGGMDVDAVFVDQDAQRFGAETFMMADALLAQEASYCVFDESGLNDFLQARINAGYVQTAETVEELGEKLGIDGEALAATIAAYNEDIADGTDDAFGKENAGTIEGTVYGYQFGVGTHYCMGGILINGNAEVVREDGTPIENLYAAGEVTGGFHGSFRVDGSGLGDSFIFGRIAGRNAAETALAK